MHLSGTSWTLGGGVWNVFVLLRGALGGTSGSLGASLGALGRIFLKHFRKIG